jgi:HlyD family secretion protein
MSRLALPLMALSLVALPAPAVVLTGEVRSVGAQPIYTPQSNTAPVAIRYFVAEGQAVKAGEVVLRIDPGQAGTQIPDLDAKIEQARAKAAKELAELEVKAVDAEVALADAEAALATAKIEAAIPRGLVSQLDYDRHQGELDKTTRELVLKREQFAAARAAVARRHQDAKLEVDKLAVQREYYAALLRQSEVRAERDGIVLHGFNNNWIAAWKSAPGRWNPTAAASPSARRCGWRSTRCRGNACRAGSRPSPAPPTASRNGARAATSASTSNCRAGMRSSCCRG